MNEFAKYHPLINFIYFTAVIVFSMIFVHPICLVTSLLCSAIYSIILNGKKAIIIGDRDGIPGPAIEECVKTAGAEVIYSSTECFV